MRQGTGYQPVEGGQVGADSVQHVGGHSVCQHCQNLGVIDSKLGQRALSRGADARSVAFHATDHQQHRGVQVGRHPGVESEFGGGSNVGVVRAQNDHGLVVVTDLGVLGHQSGQCGVGVGADVSVGHPDCVVVGLVYTGLGEQSAQDFVRAASANDRTKHPDRTHGSG